MFSFALHPNVYSTNPSINGLLNMLESIWVRNHKLGEGTIYIISGFSNYNGGIRFFDLFRQHVDLGGKIVAVLGGSTSQRLSSQQVVEELLKSGVEVLIVNRKRLLHAKCYGISSKAGESLIVTSGNFTGPGMSQNAEASILLDQENTKISGFSWNSLLNSILQQKWDFYKPTLMNRSDPSWKLLYDEVSSPLKIDETQEVTLIITLSHADTARIRAQRGTTASKGTQYFWLSKDSFDFFPPLTIKNTKGYKSTFSTIITLHYSDLHIKDENCRITFEAENNLDFRLGTGKLRSSNIADMGDIAAITRYSETEYILKIYKKNSPEFNLLEPYAINFIGHQGKKFGYIPNSEYEKELNIKIKSLI